MATEQDVNHPCASCDGKTFHEPLHTDTQSEHEYRIDTIHQMLRCRGCHTISFRRVVRDYESSYPTGEDEWEAPEEITNYPNTLVGHKELNGMSSVPDTVRDIYTQSVDAIGAKSNTLAGIGLRATIEAICNDRSISGRDLEKRIDALAKHGMISQKDAERLHAIRFLGNDAAHQVKRSDARNLRIALRIIDHLLVNIYILDGEADGHLDTILKSFDDFELLLGKKLKDFSSGDEVPLAKIFGRDLRRFHGYFPVLEKELASRVAQGAYGKIRIGKIDNYSGSKQPVQHYIVV